MKRNMVQAVKITTAVGLVALCVVTLLSGEVSLAQSSAIQDGVNSIGGNENSASMTEVIKTIINTLLFLIGAIAVVMIIFGGFKYVTSSGESSAVASAKNTILYAVIGLVVAVLAFTIVNFVLDVFDEGTSSTQTATGTRDPRYNLSPEDPKYIGPTP